ncbi:hypothetical protein [Nonomuraea roseoviolacea]|uniref:PspC domain-containing protein n=1 Tax=Nonomuraea roseoviolacea subsp. carminata TaxID=160689 RepID=A0ABT1K4R2_9ACTN|nr:hypothetical protein [Nonomuraea roseoviolacea]MCP2348019.1 hypothetical protein [Nonomuraea roseoviolacea subsp. carminata]
MSARPAGQDDRVAAWPGGIGVPAAGAAAWVIRVGLPVALWVIRVGVPVALWVIRVGVP